MHAVAGLSADGDVAKTEATPPARALEIRPAAFTRRRRAGRPRVSGLSVGALRRSRAYSLRTAAPAYSDQRLFRCADCKWRGWWIPLEFTILRAGGERFT